MALMAFPGHKPLRLHLLLRDGELPAWQRMLLAGLRRDAGDDLLLSEGKLGEGVAAGSCDVLLVFEADVLNQAGGLPSGLPCWLPVDAQGRALSREYPLLSEISRGQGIALLLLECRSGSSEWRWRRRLHVRAPSRYAWAAGELAPNLLRLLRQAAIDVRLRVDADAVVEAPGLAVNDGAAWGHRLNGLLHHFAARLHAQWLTEYWRIGVIDCAPGKLITTGDMPAVHWLTPDSPDDYWADPFPMPGDSRRLFCERVPQRSGLGVLEMLEFDAGGQLSGQRRLAVGDGAHASFPNVFEVDGQRFGIAETVATRRCVLHEVDDAGGWHPRTTLLEGVAAADPAIFRWQGRWWLAYTDLEHGELDNLCLQHAESLDGPWLPHANNPVKIDIRGARMAGRLFELDGQLYRPGQDCLTTYGAGVVLYRIEHLTPEHFVEREVRRLWPDRRGACPDGLHTFNLWENRIVIDGKRHGFNFWVFRRNVQRRLARILGRQRLVQAGVAGRARVIVYIPWLRLGGGETSMLRVAAGLLAEGYAVDIVSHGVPEPGIVIPDGVGFIDLACSGTLSALWRLVKLLRRERPDCLLSAFPHTNIAAVLARSLAGVETRCVLSEHAPLSQQIEQQANWRYRVLPRLVRLAYRRADAVVAVSQGVRADLVSMLGDGRSVEVINNPVLADGFAEEMQADPDDPWLLDDSLQVVLSMSRLSEEKDLPTLLQAFAEMHRRHPHARLLMAGEGRERAHLAEMVRAAGLEAVVRLPGQVATPLSWMRRAAVFVLSSRFEGFGNALVEAMACGTPVVSTDCPVGPREILDDGRLGALVPVGNVAALAAAIEAALLGAGPPPESRAKALGFTQAATAAAYRKLLARFGGKLAAC